MNILVYHDPCMDGFTAAWVFRDWAEKLVGANYGVPLDLDQFKGHDVIFVDFSLPRDKMICIEEMSKSLLVLDHHKSAQKELEGLNFAIFDMNKSGASLAWEYLHPGTEIPLLIQYVEDHDIWKHQMPDWKEIGAAIRSIDRHFDCLDRLQRMLTDSALIASGYDILFAVGRALNFVKAETIDRLIKTRYKIRILDYSVYCVDTSVHISDIGAKLCDFGPFGVTRYRDANLIRYSLRSKGEMDVSIVAKHFGGGGHKNAAGFEISAFTFDENIDDSITT